MTGKGKDLPAHKKSEGGTMVSGKKNPKLPVKKGVPTVRSSAAEYLTFIAATGSSGVEAVYADESIWLTQKMMGVLYDVETHTINYHLKKVFSDSELQEDAVIRNFRITAADGKNNDATVAAGEAQVEIQILNVLKRGIASSADIAKALGHRSLSGNLRKALPYYVPV